MDDILAIGKRELEVTPSGFDPVARTLRYVAATQNPCQSYRAGPDGEPMLVMEVLRADGCVNIGAIAGTPLLNCHKRETLTDVLGRQTGGEVVGDTIVCTANLSRRADVQALDCDFADGVFNKVSVGYSNLRELPPDMSTNPPTVVVTAWQLDEVSVVPVPADLRAGIRARAQAAREATVQPTTEPNMTDLEKALADAATQFTTTILTAVRAAAPKPAAPPTETDEAKAKREKDEKDAAARAKRDDEDGDGDEGGDGDGTGGDSDERKRKRAALIANLKTILGTRSLPAFDALVAVNAPAKHLRAAVLGLAPAVGERAQIEAPKPEVVVGTGARAGQALPSFKDFGAGSAK